MPWSQEGATHYHEQSGLQEKGRARIYDLWDGFLDKRKVRGLVPCCGQDGHGAQIPQINTYIHNCYWRKLSIYLHNQASSPLKKTFNVVVKKISLSLCKSKNIQGYLAGCVFALQLILHSESEFLVGWYLCAVLACRCFGHICLKYSEKFCNGYKNI